jgi:hypothetical protein
MSNSRREAHGWALARGHAIPKLGMECGADVYRLAQGVLAGALSGDNK